MYTQLIVRFLFWEFGQESLRLQYCTAELSADLDKPPHQSPILDQHQTLHLHGCPPAVYLSSGFMQQTGNGNSRQKNAPSCKVIGSSAPHPANHFQRWCVMLLRNTQTSWKKCNLLVRGQTSSARHKHGLHAFASVRRLFWLSFQVRLIMLSSCTKTVPAVAQGMETFAFPLELQDWNRTWVGLILPSLTWYVYMQKWGRSQ